MRAADPELLDRVREIFLAVVRAAPAERDLLLRSWCGDDPLLRHHVDELLAFNDAEDGPLDRMLAEPSRWRDASRAVWGGSDGCANAEGVGPIGPGERIGRFEVVSLIGEGGMGVVYLCRQERPSRLVAVKLVRRWFATPSVLRRFELEAEVLGRLQHPGIAAIFEAGTIQAEGSSDPHVVPYFAMEYVQGVPLDRYCEAHALDARQRVALLAKVCDAVSHAHQRDVIHRDLKHDNILVDQSGQPKVLDFGVARAAGGSACEHGATLHITGARQVVGTLAYMSPEQAAGAPEGVDARADVYALGVLLFALLADRLPIDVTDRSLPDAIRAIREDAPPRLGSIVPGLRGDVETIVGRAMERECDRRYQSAAGLAADLRRWLASEPITARPASALYVLGKLIRRRRGAAIGSAVAAGAIGVGLTVAVPALRWASAERENSALATLQRGQVAEVLTELVRSIDPALAEGGDTSALRRVLDDARARVEQDLGEQHDVESSLLGTIARGYARLGAFDAASETAERALVMHQDPAGSARKADDLALLGQIAFMRGDADSAVSRFNEALAMRRAIRGDDHSDVGESLRDLAEVATSRGDLGEAEQLLRQAQEIQRNAPGDTARRRMALTLTQLGSVVGRGHRTAEAHRALDDAVAILEGLGDASDPDLAASLMDRGFLAAVAHHDIGSAERDFRRALEIRVRRLGPDHSATADTRQQIAQLLAMRGEVEEAQRMSREAVQCVMRSLGPSSPAYAKGLGRMGEVLSQAGDMEGAEAAFNEALAVFQRTRGDDHEAAAAMRSMLLTHWRQLREYERALPLAVDQLACAERPDAMPDALQVTTLVESTEVLAQSAWRRVAQDPHSTASADAPAIARRAEEVARRMLERTEASTGYLRYLPRMHAASALLAVVLTEWAKEPGRFQADQAVARLAEAERLLTLSHDEATICEEALPFPMDRGASIRDIEVWSTRLYWLWARVAPDERVEGEFARWRATGGGTIGRLPEWERP